jgi:twitching motility protein PilU
MSRFSIAPLLEEFVSRKASDLYLTVDAPPMLRISDQIFTIGKDKLSEDDVRHMLRELVSEEVIEEFESTLEYNTAFNWNDQARFRINVYKQRQFTGIVLRRIQTQIPTLDQLGLPALYADLIMEKRGLVLVVGPTGSGKSTSLASMLEHRNTSGAGHIVTIEDPIEFVHAHKGCIFSQRDVGVDTYSFGIALKNALRQRPDVIVIGEIRDRETMEHAIVFAETGHLCVATLHANNANQTIERIINFFPEEKHPQILLNLSLNLKAILSQRLVGSKKGNRVVALEVLLNRGLIKSLIQEGKVKEIREIIEASPEQGMMTFDQSLFELFKDGVITEEVALAEADNIANLRLRLKQHEVGSKYGSIPPGTRAPANHQVLLRKSPNEF